MCAQWLAARGITKVGSFWEQGSSGRDYADYFRDTAGQLGLTVVREVKLEPNPKGLRDDLAMMRDLGVEGLYYGGYGYATFHFADALKALDWDPPRVMGTAFMFYSNSNKWAEGLEGWHGVDQLGEDGANPNYEAMMARFEKRFGRVDPQRRRGPGLRHRPGRDPRHRQRRHPHAQARQGGHGAHPLDARHQRRPRHLHPVRAARPQGLQGRLPHDPRAARRRAALRRLPPARVALERGRSDLQRQGLHPRVHRHRSGTTGPATCTT